MQEAVQEAKEKTPNAPGSQGIVVRKARVSDVEAMHRIINHYAEKQLMLPKTHHASHNRREAYKTGTIYL